MGTPEYIVRLQIEISELAEKKQKLRAFFESNVFENLDAETQSLMMAQEDAMSIYLKLLIMRFTKYQEN